jgi:hypothetical protein
MNNTKSAEDESEDDDDLEYPCLCCAEKNTINDMPDHYMEEHVVPEQLSQLVFATYYIHRIETTKKYRYK